ncbi:four helix bundle protein [Flectobacillus sp. DC10W]|uniref:Four helix bundle protein n=1 Tax=Flectobacillus longus TaxID=2984207 RepID=A0ABT6YQW4_9BACT|nr:four helix bundle protein [Flectobacillus longus]MDI9865857.1 four helix bundle protein [Flectobacillus longus]
MEISSFQDLKCWKEAVKLRIMLRTVLQLLPSDEKYRLKDQIVRASRSVTNNIAEGFGRYHYLENVQFCRQSRGSLSELEDHLLIAVEENFILKEDFSQLQVQINTCTALLNGYINYLNRAKVEAERERGKH